MVEILAKAFSLVLIIVIGYAIKRAGWVSSSDFPKFSKILLRVTLPCAVLTSFNEFDISYDLLFLTALAVIINVIQQVSGYLVNRRNSAREKAFSIINIGSYNIGAFATPYLSGFMGKQAIIYTSLFDVGNAVGAAGIGYGWAMSVSRENQKPTAGRFLKSMFASPVFDTYVFALILRLLDYHLPNVVLDFTSAVGSANTFIAMLMIGIGLELRLDPKKYRNVLKYLGMRYGFAVLFTALVLFCLPFSREAKTVLCMLFFAPIGAMSAGFTSEAGCDVETSTFMTSVSIIIGIVVMPLILMIMG